MLNYVLDEHIPIAYRNAILRIVDGIEVLRVGEVGAPELGTSDPKILIWREENGFALVINNRKSMPEHLEQHVASGRHIAGIFVADLEGGVGANADALAIYSAASHPAEFQDQIVYI